MGTSGRPEIDYGNQGLWDRLETALLREYFPRPNPGHGYIECPFGWNWRPNLRDYDLWFVVKGRGQVTLGPDTYNVEAGTLLLLRPGDTGWAIQHPEDHLTVIYAHFTFLNPETGDEARPPNRLLPSRHIPFDHPASFELQLMHVVRLLDSRRPLSGVEASLALQQTLLDVYRQDAANHGHMVPRLDPRLERIISHLIRMPEERLSLDAAAELAGLSAAYFSRLFTEQVGLSFRQYVVHTRLVRGRYLLEETDMPIGHIARALGYDEVFLFSRQFRHRYGISPRQVRNPGKNIID